MREACCSECKHVMGVKSGSRCGHDFWVSTRACGLGPLHRVLRQFSVQVIRLFAAQMF